MEITAYCYKIFLTENGCWKVAIARQSSLRRAIHGDLLKRRRVSTMNGIDKFKLHDLSLSILFWVFAAGKESAADKKWRYEFLASGCKILSDLRGSQ